MPGPLVTAFCDSHSKTMSPGDLAEGTNWIRDLNAADLKLIDASRYYWGER
jgi:hypothetical protein